MAKFEIFDLEKNFAFYGAYHSNKTNILIHMIFVWPILFSSGVILHFTPALFEWPFKCDFKLVPNVGFVFVVIYGVFYICLDKKAGSLGAFMCFLSWVFGSLLAEQLGYSLAWKLNNLGTQAGSLGAFMCFASCVFGTLPAEQFGYSFAWKVVLAAQLVCWTGQFIGHGVFEKRAPALLDNLTQAFLMAPFFVLLEALQSFGYEPYQGFHASVKKKIDTEIKKFQDQKAKKST